MSNTNTYAYLCQKREKSKIADIAKIIIDLITSTLKWLDGHNSKWLEF